MCMGSTGRKRTFQSEHGAQVAAERLRKRTGEPVKAYWCALHGGYHVGHPPGWRKAQRMKSDGNA